MYIYICVDMYVCIYIVCVYNNLDSVSLEDGESIQVQKGVGDFRVYVNQCTVNIGHYQMVYSMHIYSHKSTESSTGLLYVYY